MSIPIIAGLIGYDSWYVKLYRELCQLLGNPKKFELGWVASEKKLVIHTDRVDDTTLTEVAALAATLVPAGVTIVQYNHHIELTYDEYMKYSKCKTIQDMEAINPEYYNDVTDTGVFAYNLDSLQVFTSYSAEKG